MTLLKIENLSVELATSQGAARAVSNLSFTLNKGEILGVAGESGSGKTMTALSLMRLLPHKGKASGSLVFNGRDLLALSNKEYCDIRGNEIAMVFQDPMTSLHPMLNIDTQITEHIRHHKKISHEAARLKALELLGKVKIPDPASALHALPRQFSGGMRQRIAIAIALACDPKILIADEPTTALDVTVQAGILKLLDELRKENNLAVMVITHDLGVLSSITNKLMIMYAGSEVESGITSDVLKHPKHPYTKGLIAALPSSNIGGKILQTIEGMPPELGRKPDGCSFAPRCSHAQAFCSQSLPTKVQISAEHRIFCSVNPWGAQ